jgi:superfamily II DNA or RNA helicase
MKSIDGGVLAKSVTIHETGFKTPAEAGHRPPYHVLIHCLTNDLSRNQRIADLTIKTFADKSFPLLISDRKDHLDLLQTLIKERATGAVPIEIVRLDGDLGVKQRRIAIEQLATFRAESKPVLLMSTGSLIGEGFDLPELDTLILATPLSFEGRMVQYAGRIHRLVEGKTKVQIIDFVDSYSAMMIKMYRNRVEAYRKMGYTIHDSSSMFATVGRKKSAPTTSNLRFELQ